MYRNNLIETNPVKSYGFLILVKAEEGTSIELIKDHLEGACSWVEGVGRTEVDYLGEIVEESEDGEETESIPTV